MAVYNEILVGRINRFLQKLTSIKGPPPTPQLSSEVMAVLQLFNGVENRFLDSWQRFGMGSTAAGVTSNQSGLRLRNPAGSNVIAVVETFLIANTHGSLAQNWNVTVGAIATDLATVIGLTGARLDPRGNPQPTCIFSQQNTTPSIAGLTAQPFIVATVAETSFEVIPHEDAEIALLPGDAIQVVGAGLVQPATLSIVWRERFLEDSERA